MIVRVLGHGQWVLQLEHLEALNEIDIDLEAAVDQADTAKMRDALQRLFDGVRELGIEVPDDVIVESDLVLPDPDASLEEVRILLESTGEYFGLIPDDAPNGADEGN